MLDNVPQSRRTARFVVLVGEALIAKAEPLVAVDVLRWAAAAAGLAVTAARLLWWAKRACLLASCQYTYVVPSPLSQ